MELSDLMKTFYKKFNDRYGEDMAVAISCEGDIVESLNKYSNNLFIDYNAYDIYKELLKNEALSNSEDVILGLTQHNLKERKLDDLYKAIDNKPQFKAGLIRSFIRSSHLTYGKQLANAMDENARFFFRMIDRYDPDIENRSVSYTKKISY